ncbi:MAG: undecaprenyl-diphosphate phosphatase [Ilumatobacteraceae bacterium]
MTSTATEPSTSSPHTRWWLAGAAACVLAVAAAGAARSSVLSPTKAVVLGAVEGITEFLPISSTGHLLVAERILGLGGGASKDAADTYAVAIQLGAILAVVGVYRRHIASMLNGLIGRDVEGRRLLSLLIVAFIPSAVVGLALDNTIKTHLFGIWPIIAAWTVGGVFLLAWHPPTGHTGLDQITAHQHARFIIGAAQILALWPGTSRSLVTIAAALALGLTTSAAVEFSFLLGLMTLSAATALDLVKHGHDLTTQFGYAAPAPRHDRRRSHRRTRGQLVRQLPPNQAHDHLRLVPPRRSCSCCDSRFRSLDLSFGRFGSRALDGRPGSRPRSRSCSPNSAGRGRTNGPSPCGRRVSLEN